MATETHPQAPLSADFRRCYQALSQKPSHDSVSTTLTACTTQSYPTPDHRDESGAPCQEERACGRESA